MAYAPTPTLFSWLGSRVLRSGRDLSSLEIGRVHRLKAVCALRARAVEETAGPFNVTVDP